MLQSIYEKASFVNKVYSGELSLDDVPQEWKYDVEQKVSALTEERYSFLKDYITLEDLAEALESIM